MKFYFYNNMPCMTDANMSSGTEITEDQYKALADSIMSFSKAAPDGKYYQLQINGKWELRDLPPAPPSEEDLAQAEYAALTAAYERGVNDA